MSLGWVKLHRSLIDHPRYKDPEWVAVWVHLILKATHQPIKMRFGKENVVLSSGQFITSRDSISEKTGVNRSKVERVLKCMEIEQQIEQRKCTTSRLITILNWVNYQGFEQPSEQKVSSKRAASEQRVSTNKNIRIEEGKKGEETPALFPSNLQFTVEPPKNPSAELRANAVLLITYLNETAGRKYEPCEDNLKPVMKRLAEGHSPEEIQKMIRREVANEGGSSKWLRPQTLFGVNFHGAYGDRDLPTKNGKPTQFDKPRYAIPNIV